MKKLIGIIVFLLLTMVGPSFAEGTTVADITGNTGAMILMVLFICGVVFAISKHRASKGKSTPLTALRDAKEDIAEFTDDAREKIEKFKR